MVQDTQSGIEYALKRLLGSDKQACNTIIRELNFHKQLSGHPNIVKFIAASFIDRTQSGQGNAEYLLVTELCNGESFDVRQKKKRRKDSGTAVSSDIMHTT